MSKQFYVEYNGDIDCSNKELGYMKCYETTIDGYKEAVKDLKTHKACQAKQLALTEKALKLACHELYCELENPYNELYTKSIYEYIDYFKIKAEEMMKSE